MLEKTGEIKPSLVSSNNTVHVVGVSSAKRISLVARLLFCCFLMGGATMGTNMCFV